MVDIALGGQERGRRGEMTTCLGHVSNVVEAGIAETSGMLGAAVLVLCAATAFDELQILDRRRFANLKVADVSITLAEPQSGDEDVLLAIPRAAALTDEALRKGMLAHFLESTPVLKSLSKHRGQIPSTFVFALWYFFQLYAGDRPHADPLWQAWAQRQQAAKTGMHALWRWTDEELAVLDEERLRQGAVEFRVAVREQYDFLMRPIAGNFSSFFPPDLIDFKAFEHAVSIAMAHKLPVDGIAGDAIVPLPLRQHTRGSVQLEEVEQEILTAVGEVKSRLMVQLVRTGEASGAMRAGDELLHATHNSNDEIFLMHGYLWDDLKLASVPLRMSLTEAGEGTIERKRELLAAAKLNETSDFQLYVGGLPPKMMLWQRIVHATAEELARADRPSDLEGPLSEVTEAAVYGAVYRSINEIRAAFEHDPEEDEFLLAGGALDARAMLAVRSRRLSKLVLDDGLKRTADQANEGEKLLQRKKTEAASATKGSKSPSAKGGSGGGGYSTTRERKREEAARRKKEDARRERRERKAAKDKEQGDSASSGAKPAEAMSEVEKARAEAGAAVEAAGAAVEAARKEMHEAEKAAERRRR